MARPVEKRDLDQWFLRTTKYADELLRFDGIDWPEPIRIQQTNWIGRSEGAEIDFETAPDEHQPGGDQLRVFTTRPDTLFGATFMVLAPEHPLVERLTHPDRRAEVAAYVGQARRRTEIDRLSTDREKTGVALGADAINPINGERIPLFIADYVLSGYGTGAIMAVPAHDERDYAFAVKFGLPIRRVVAAPDVAADAPMDSAYIAHAAGERLVNSGEFDGLPADEGGKAIVARLAETGRAEPKVTYRLRDWLISRQRYWGTPIPVIYCPTDGIVPVPDEDLPVRLPETVDYHGSGDNPLNHDEAFLNVACPRCGGPARRETDTMDTFVDSSWYWFRYLSPDKGDGPVDGAMVERWTPVDQYTGGAEHAVMHLLYARFWTKAMADIGLIDRARAVQAPVQPGPDPGRGRRADVEVARQRPGPRRAGRPLRRRHGPAVPDVHGAVGPGRAVEPDRDRRRPSVPEPGVDAGDRPERARARRPRCGLAAGRRDRGDGPGAIRAAAHRTLRDVTADYEAFHFNTMVAKLMELANTLFRYRGTAVAGSPDWDEAMRLLLLMLAPAAPHITEELWSRHLAAAGEPWASIHVQSWPEVDIAATAEATREVPVQVNGKLRDKLTVPTGIEAAALEAAALASPKVATALAGRTPDRVILAGGGKLVNIVVRD